MIARPEESYRLWCVVVCDLESSGLGRPWPALGRSVTGGGGEYTTISVGVSIGGRDFVYKIVGGPCSNNGELYEIIDVT